MKKNRAGAKEAPLPEDAQQALRLIRQTLLSIADWVVDVSSRIRGPRGYDDDSVILEFAPGLRSHGNWRTGDEASEGASWELNRLRRDYPSERYYPIPKAIPAPAMARRHAISDAQRVILEAYERHKSTLQVMIARYQADKGWESGYQVAWTQHGMSLERRTQHRKLSDDGTWVVIEETVQPRQPVSTRCRGARDKFHANTKQASIINLWVEHGLMQMDGLGAALHCDYLCAACKADALRIIDTILAAYGDSEAMHQVLRTRAGHLRKGPREILRALDRPAATWAEVENRAGLNVRQNRKWSAPMQSEGLIERRQDGSWHRTRRGTEKLREAGTETGARR